jgi:hypothetical protein
MCCYSESQALRIALSVDLCAQRVALSTTSALPVFSDLDLSELKLMANHVCALNTNWTREAPEVVGAVRVMDCPEAGQTVAIVPGANWILFQESGSLQVSHPYEYERLWLQWPPANNAVTVYVWTVILTECCCAGQYKP